MKQKLLMKSLLAAAALGVGTNAWATADLTKSLEVTGYEPVLLIDFQNKSYDGTTIASFDDLTTTFGVSAQNAVGSAYGNNNWYDDTNNNHGLRLQSGGGRWIQFTTEIKTDDYIIINGGAALESYEITMTNGESATVTEASDYLCFKATADADNLKLTAHRYNYLLQILVMRKSASAVTADYTINYKDGETTVKTENGTGIVVGTVIPVTTSFFVDDKKYSLNDGQPTTLTVAAGGTTIDVAVSEAAKYSYTVNAMNGEDKIEEITTGTEYAGEQITVAFHRYYNISGTLYQKGANSNEYKQKFALDADNKVVSLAYTASSFTDVVFFEEAEDIATLSEVSTGTANTRCSNTKGAYASEEAVITTLSKGKYKITGSGFGGHLVFKAAGVVILDIPSNNYWREITSDEFSVPTETEITFVGGNDTGNASLDYVIIQKTGDCDATVTKTISEAGWATYCSPYALDLRDVASIENLEAAYAITGHTGNTLTLAEINQTVEAGAGILLKGNGACAIPVVASGTAVEGNLLKGVTVATEKEQNSIYVLMDGENGVGFYKNGNETAFTVGANTAYLDATDVDGAGARSFFGFGETTGISSVKAELTMGEVYNLNGQRVSAPRKGLYIMDGKKVIVK